MRNVTLLLLLSFLFIPSYSEAENDPEKRLERARRNFNQGKYEAALNDHVWFHENALKYKQSLCGVRLSFALSDWIELGKKYPPAFAKLKEIRDIKTDKIISGGGSFDLFNDVESINLHIGESIKTVQLFKTISSKNPELAKECYRVAKDSLIKHREFKICNGFVKKPLDKLGNLKGLLDSDLKMYKGTEMEERMIGWTINHYLEETEQIVLILVKNNRFDEARLFLKEASRDIDNQKIIGGLKDIEKKYMANIKRMNSN